MRDLKTIMESCFRYLLNDLQRMGRGGFAVLGRGAVCVGFYTDDSLQDGYFSAGELVRRRIGGELVRALARYRPESETLVLFRGGAGVIEMLTVQDAALPSDA